MYLLQLREYFKLWGIFSLQKEVNFMMLLKQTSKLTDNVTRTERFPKHQKMYYSIKHLKIN
jgi:hypothetical protein